MVPCSMPVDAANTDMPKWNKIDGRVFGINRKMIPSTAWTVLKLLQNRGNIIIARISIFAAIALIFPMLLTHNLVPLQLNSNMA